MITLYQFPSYWDMPNVSPFCMKVETYLKITKLPYKIRSVRDPRKAPKGKLPFIKDDDKTIADSDFIIKYLEERYNTHLDKGLTPEQKAISLSLQRMLEEHFYWVIVYSRWLDPAAWPTTREVFFQGLPSIIKRFLPEMIQKQMRKVLYAQGLGRHSQEQIYDLGIQDIDAVAILLGEKPYLFGEQVTTIDAIAFSFLYTTLKPPIASPLKTHLQHLPNILSYCDRMLQYFN